jgi:hypothetical protein
MIEIVLFFYIFITQTYIVLFITNDVHYFILNHYKDFFFNMRSPKQRSQNFSFHFRTNTFVLNTRLMKKKIIASGAILGIVII